ncbi:flavin reductase [Geobacillus sp. NFOSA3]|uniref:Phenol 2-hydroxylase component B n=2 Tax=Parageobacillus TaxID=1906945 RepID=Q9LAG2_PARTM|nr:MULTISPECIES: flavin reductase family protein [Parageobacillus]AAF66547.1 phenol 2-hydroxylase component B [Parageobacillus thermoglucosidasius]NNU94223.1 flavin reductase [Geobacillus sp. NFOSA3]OQP01187.1 flavin reductase [Geobacillus sp. 44C]MED4970053.1 flavin reductase family protein [Parageobacillus toebii]OXB92040.1 flavin reductase [Parageobacillus galactosidasius]
MDDRLFRNAMGKFATGVTVITTELNGAVHGMTANAFMSVSLNPKLVLVSIGEKAKMLEKIQQSKKYAVNILSQDQKVLSMNFAGQLEKPVDVQFEELGGLPVIKDALAQISCQVVNEVQAGDHTLFIGEVTDIKITEQDPLLFFSGKYHQLAQNEKVETSS